MEDKGNLESARRTLQLASSVFRYAVATVRLTSDPTRDLRGALISPKVTHYGSEEHTSELQSLMRISYAVFCLKKKKLNSNHTENNTTITRKHKKMYHYHLL